MHHRFWEPSYPTVRQGEEIEWAFRSMISVSKRLKTRQPDVDSSDITAAIFEIEARTVVLFSLCIPPIEQGKDNVEELKSRFEFDTRDVQHAKKDLPTRKIGGV